MKLSEIYATLPSINCKKLCWDYCGYAPMTVLEEKQIDKYLGYKVNWKFQTWNNHKGLKWRCPVLKNGLCRAHPARPIICRLWGVVDMDRMRCPHGCEPERWLTEEEATEIFRLVEEAEEA